MSKIVKNASFYTIGNILPQAVNFFLLPVYTYYLSPEEYGIISSMQVLSSVLVIFFTLAVERSMTRLYFDYNTDSAKKDYLGTVTISLFVIAFLVLIAVFLLQGFIGQIFSSIPFYPFYAYSILTAFFSVFQFIPRIYYQLTEQADRFVLISLGQFILNTGFVVWFVVVNREGAQGMLRGELYANVALLPILVYIILKIINFKFKFEILKQSLQFSIPMIPVLLSSFVLNLSDRIFIEQYFTLKDVGIYSLGYKIAGLTGVITSSFFLAYQPVFYRYAKAEDQSQAKTKLGVYNEIYVVLVLLAASFTALFSKDVILILLDQKYHEAYKIIPIISFTYVIIQITSLFNLMIYQYKKSIAIMYVQIVSAICCIGISFLLIPKFGAYGAAISTLISFSLAFTASGIYALRCYYVPIRWKLIIKILIPTILTIILFLYVLDINVVLSLSLKIFISLITVFYFGRKYLPILKSPL